MRAANKIEPLTPTEENGFCVFDPQWESDPLILFHMSDPANLQSILQGGFKSAADLGSGELQSVSYAKKSSGCFAHLGTTLTAPKIIVAVRFSPSQLKEVTDNPSDIHVYKPHLQPEIVGYCELPSGFCLP